MNRFLLFIFNLKSISGYSQIITNMAESTDTELLKYKISGNSIILNFGSNLEIKKLTECVNNVVNEFSDSYFLVPHSDNMSVNLPEDELEEFLSLEIKDNNKKADTLLEQQILDEMNIDGNELLRDYILSLDDVEFDEDDDDMLLKKPKKVEYRLNDILDKINEKGIGSLSEKEKNYLNNLYK